MRALIASIFPRWLGNYSVELSAEYQEYEKLCATRQSITSPITSPGSYGFFDIEEESCKVMEAGQPMDRQATFISILLPNTKRTTAGKRNLGFISTYEKKAVRIMPGLTVASPVVCTGKINYDQHICLIRSCYESSRQSSNELIIAYDGGQSYHTLRLGPEPVTSILPYDDFLIVQQEKESPCPQNASKIYSLVYLNEGKIEKTITQ